MVTVYQTLDGTFILREASYLWRFNIDDISRFITYAVIGREVRGNYFFENNSLFFKDTTGDTNKSVHTATAKVIQSLKEGTYSGEVTIVSDDFFDLLAKS